MGTGREQLNVGRFVAGGLAGCLAKTCVAPLERTRIAAQVTSQRQSSASLAMGIVRDEGVLGLWRGNGIAVVRTFPSKAIVFGGNDYYKRALLALPVAPPRAAVDAAAGGLAGLTAVAITYPLDVLRTMVSATGADGGKRSAYDAIASTLRSRGPAAFYVGVAPTMVGGTFHEAARFGIFDSTRRWPLFDHGAWWANLACGSMAGVLAGVILYPNDTVRRQLQMGTYDTYFGAARGLVRTAGVPRLYAGLAPYLFRAGPGAAIQFATFGELKKLLDAPPR